MYINNTSVHVHAINCRILTMVKVVVTAMMTVAVSGEDEGGSGDEIPVHSTKNIIAISFSTNTTDASTQTLDTQQCTRTCRCDQVMKKLDTILDVLTNIGDELASHGSDIYEIRLKSEAIQDKLEQQLVSYMYICTSIYTQVCIWNNSSACFTVS